MEAPLYVSTLKVLPPGLVNTEPPGIVNYSAGFLPGVGSHSSFCCNRLRFSIPASLQLGEPWFALWPCFSDTSKKSHIFSLFSFLIIVGTEWWAPSCLYSKLEAWMFSRFSLSQWVAAIWLRRALVWFLLCFFCLRFMELFGTVGLMFLSNLKKNWPFFHFCLLPATPFLLDSNYTYVWLLNIAPQLTDALLFSSLFSLFHFG